MQISVPTLENTYPSCNYVNCLWLFIQLFTLVFAHAFICHIRGWQWCPESGRLSPQALWTDNGLRKKSPSLQSCAAELTPSQRPSYGGRLLWRGQGVSAHWYTTRSAQVPLWPLVQIFCWQTSCTLSSVSHLFIWYKWYGTSVSNNKEQSNTKYLGWIETVIWWNNSH